MPWLVSCLAVLFVAALVAGLHLRTRVRLLAVENDRWRALAQERVDRVAVVSHEVRTPLALIRGSSELMMDGAVGPVNARQASMLEMMHATSGEVIALAENLLMDARIDADLFKLNTAKVDVRRLVTRVVREMRGLYPNQITLSARGAVPRILGDGDLIRQALINLITNAARHAGDGAQIAVSVRPTDDGVMIVVRDNGTGMSDEQKRALFRDGLAGRSETGHGLGMLITRRIVELHGGRCLVDTMSDVGTAVMCVLPKNPRPAVSVVASSEVSS